LTNTYETEFANTILLRHQNLKYTFKILNWHKKRAFMTWFLQNCVIAKKTRKCQSNKICGSKFNSEAICNGIHNINLICDVCFLRAFSLKQKFVFDIWKFVLGKAKQVQKSRKISSENSEQLVDKNIQ
jgi:hypothetical protein